MKPIARVGGGSLVSLAGRSGAGGTGLVQNKAVPWQPREQNSVSDSP